MLSGIVVPISIIGTTMQYVFGHRLDRLSLMGLAITIGMVLNDSIVMVATIARHIELRKTTLQAALRGRGVRLHRASISVSLSAVLSRCCG